MEEMGREARHVLPGRRGQAQGKTVLWPAGQADGGDGDQVVDFFRRLFGRRGGIDTHLRADGSAQMVHQPVQGLGGPVPGVVEVAREQGDAKRFADHGYLESGDEGSSLFDATA